MSQPIEKTPDPNVFPTRDFSDAELESFAIVSQEGFDIQPVGGKPGIITWGINPCIIIMFHNPDHGIYLAHTLAYNFFFRNKISTACRPGQEASNDCIPEDLSNRGEPPNKLRIPIECGGNSILESFPPWAHAEKTVCSLFAHTDDGWSGTLNVRLEELKEVYKGTLHIYRANNFDRVVILQDGTICAPTKDWSQFSDRLKDMGKLKDMALFRSQIAYFLAEQKQKGVKLNAIKALSNNDIEMFVNPDFTFKPAANDVSNYRKLSNLTIEYGKRGLIFRECLVQQGGRRLRLRLRSKTRRRQSRRGGRRQSLRWYSGGANDKINVFLPLTDGKCSINKSRGKSHSGGANDKIDVFLPLTDGKCSIRR